MKIQDTGKRFVTHRTHNLEKILDSATDIGIPEFVPVTCCTIYSVVAIDHERSPWEMGGHPNDSTISPSFDSRIGTSIAPTTAPGTSTPDLR